MTMVFQSEVINNHIWVKCSEKPQTFGHVAYKKILSRRSKKRSVGQKQELLKDIWTLASPVARF